MKQRFNWDSARKEDGKTKDRDNRKTPGIPQDKIDFALEEIRMRQAALDKWMTKLSERSELIDQIRGAPSLEAAHAAVGQAVATLFNWDFPLRGQAEKNVKAIIEKVRAS